MADPANPYAAPAARVEDAGADSEAEAIRRAHIGHEASIKAVGFLYYLGGLLVLLGALGGFMGATSARYAYAATGVMIFLVLVAAAQFAAGWGVRALKRWGQVMGCILSGLGLLAFPIGTLISAYILYLLLAKKGRMVFSPAYRDVVAATPHVKYKTSIVVWIVLALLLGLIAFAVLAPMFARS
jgi:hypothetical protein